MDASTWVLICGLGAMLLGLLWAVGKGWWDDHHGD